MDSILFFKCNSCWPFQPSFAVADTIAHRKEKSLVRSWNWNRRATDFSVTASKDGRRQSFVSTRKFVIRSVWGLEGRSGTHLTPSNKRRVCDLHRTNGTDTGTVAAMMKQGHRSFGAKLLYAFQVKFQTSFLKSRSTGSFLRNLRWTRTFSHVCYGIQPWDSCDG